jgi:diadenosine tetraphosphate (Ap4A) HIT family hydrolase
MIVRESQPEGGSHLLHEPARDEDGEHGRACDGHGRRRGARCGAHHGSRRGRHAHVHLLRRRRGEEHGGHGEEQHGRAGGHRDRVPKMRERRRQGWLAGG